MVFVVLHLSKDAMGPILVQHVEKNTKMQCKLAEDGDEIRQGHIYIAPPDFHLLVKEEKVLVIKGPHENRWRLSIDVMFRSAAVRYTSKVIGVQRR